MSDHAIRVDPLPDTCAIAFKEWAGVCDALASGRQSLILRKGGIEEGPGGFAPEHPAFWLYPTFVHEGEQGLKHPSSRSRSADAGVVEIDTMAVVETVARVDSIDALLRLDSLHDWTEETVRKRFDYRQPGLWVLGVRVYRKPEPARIEVTPTQHGCKTWVPLEAGISTVGLVPVLDDVQADHDRDRLATLLTPIEGPER